jgi:hypothetical protein
MLQLLIKAADAERVAVLSAPSVAVLRAEGVTEKANVVK